MSNNNIRCCPHCHKCFIDNDNTNCPFCKKDLNDSLQVFKDLFGKNNPFDNFKFS